MSAPTPFETEVERIAAAENVPAPTIVFRGRMAGTASTAPSGRRILVGEEVREWPEPAQRWLAGHEMWHAIAHTWRDPARWAVLVFSVACAAVLAGATWVLHDSPALGLVPGAIALGWCASITWWSRRSESQADAYAARSGYRDALTAADLLVFLTRDTNIPRWLSTHGHWADRLRVRPDEMPEPILQLSDQIAATATTLAGQTSQRWVRPYRLLVVRSLRKGRLAIGRWPHTIVVASNALTLPADQRALELRTAVIASQRVVPLRAGLTGFLTVIAFATAIVFAAGLNTPRTHTIAAASVTALAVAAAYEAWRRLRDRRLARAAEAP